MQQQSFDQSLFFFLLSFAEFLWFEKKRKKKSFLAFSFNFTNLQ